MQSLGAKFVEIDLGETGQTKDGYANASQRKIAKEAGVKKLIIGHYSSRYKDISLFKKEATQIFENVVLAETGKEFSCG